MATGSGVANRVAPASSRAAAASDSSCRRTEVASPGLSGNRAASRLPMRKKSVESSFAKLIATVALMNDRASINVINFFIAFLLWDCDELFVWDNNTWIDMNWLLRAN